MTYAILFFVLQAVALEPDLNSADPYRRLGLERNATLAEVAKAYRTLSFKYHPDHNPDDVDAKKKFNNLTEGFQAIQSGQSNIGSGTRSSTGSSTFRPGADLSGSSQKWFADFEKAYQTMGGTTQDRINEAMKVIFNQLGGYDIPTNWQDAFARAATTFHYSTEDVVQGLNLFINAHFDEFSQMSAESAIRFAKAIEGFSFGRSSEDDVWNLLYQTSHDLMTEAQRRATSFEELSDLAVYRAGHYVGEKIIRGGGYDVNQPIYDRTWGRQRDIMKEAAALYVQQTGGKAVDFLSLMVERFPIGQASLRTYNQLGGLEEIAQKLPPEEKAQLLSVLRDFALRHGTTSDLRWLLKRTTESLEALFAKYPHLRKQYSISLLSRIRGHIIHSPNLRQMAGPFLAPPTRFCSKGANTLGLPSAGRKALPPPK